MTEFIYVTENQTGLRVLVNSSEIRYIKHRVPRPGFDHPNDSSNAVITMKTGYGDTRPVLLFVNEDVETLSHMVETILPPDDKDG